MSVRLFCAILLVLGFARCAPKRVPVNVDVNRPSYSYRCNDRTNACFVWVRTGPVAPAKEELCTRQYVCAIQPVGTIYEVVRTRK